MSKTHTKINQLAGETLKGFAYANNTDKELVDDVLATRDKVTGYTKIAREYTDTNIPATYEIGFETQQISFPNIPSPLEGSAMFSFNGLDKAGVGVFDLSPLSQSPLSVGTVAIFDDGSQATNTVSKDVINTNLYDVTTGMAVNMDVSGNRYDYSGFNGTNSFGFRSTYPYFRYTANNTTQYLPITYGNSGDFLKTDGAGNWYFDTVSLSPTTTNGVVLIGSDIGLGGNLIQDTDINVYDGSDYNRFRVFGTDSAGNESGICYYPQIFNGVTGYAGAYSDISGKNKAGVYTDGQYQFYGVLGYYDGTSTLNNASHTIHNHNENLATSSRKVRLVNDDSNSVVYNKDITINGSDFKKEETASINNVLSPSFGFEYLNVIDTLSNIYREELRNNTTGQQFVTNKNFTVTTLSEIVTDGVNTHTVEHNQFGLKTTLRQFADDTSAGIGGLVSGELYQTDGTGSAPLNIAGIVMIKQ
jgi:hypothetical protein